MCSFLTFHQIILCQMTDAIVKPCVYISFLFALVFYKLCPTWWNKTIKNIYMLFFPYFVFLIKIVLRSRDDTVYWYVKVNYIHQYMGSEVIQGDQQLILFDQTVNIALKLAFPWLLLLSIISVTNKQIKQSFTMNICFCIIEL